MTGLPARLPRSGSMTKTYSILLVEDNTINYELVIECFDGQPYRVDVATDGGQAVAMFEAGHYDLVLMDLQLPVMDGLAATGRIRAIEKDTGRARTPVIAVTANAFPRDRDLCLAAGMDDYISKPFDLDAFDAMVARWLGRP